MDPHEAADDAADPDRLLAGENPASAFYEDAVHWLNVYTELLGYKRDILVQTRAMLASARHARSAQEIASTDLPLLEAEADRFERRVAFWRQRVVDLHP